MVVMSTKREEPVLLSFKQNLLKDRKQTVLSNKQIEQTKTGNYFLTLQILAWSLTSVQFII